jgi:Tol biopolymer transport system component
MGGRRDESCDAVTPYSSNRRRLAHRIAPGWGGTLLAIALAISAAVFPSAAFAAFPGANGRIAYVGNPADEDNSDIFTILPDGSGLQRLTNDSEVESAPSWSADGRRLVFARESIAAGTLQIVRMNADGGDASPVVETQRDPTRAFPYPSNPSFSPSGGRIIYTTGRAIRTIRLDGTAPRRLVTAEPRRLLGSPQYSPSGKRIAFTGAPKGKSRDGIWTMRRNGSRLRRLTDPKRIFDDVIDTDPDYSPDGRKILFLRFGFRCCVEVRVMRADGSRERAIPGTDRAWSPAFAPAGDRVALSISSGDYSGLGPSCSDIYTMSLTGSERVNMTHDCSGGIGGWHDSPTWQPLPAGPTRTAENP